MILIRKPFPLAVGGVGLFLVVANVLVAIRHLGVQPGQTYRWVCLQSGAELSFNPSVFGQARLVSAQRPAGLRYRWDLKEPRSLALWQPWNWLAIALQKPVPNPASLLDRIDTPSEVKLRKGIYHRREGP
jgi:hypothetical protein